MNADGRSFDRATWRPAARSLRIPRCLSGCWCVRRYCAGDEQLSALVAMVVAAAVTTAMLNLYVDVQAKLRREFRNYGANIILAGERRRFPSRRRAVPRGIVAGRPRSGCALCAGRGADQRRPAGSCRRHGLRSGAATGPLVVGEQLAVWLPLLAQKTREKWGTQCWNRHWLRAGAVGCIAEQPAFRSHFPGTHHSPHTRRNGADRRRGRQPSLSFAGGFCCVDGSSAFHHRSSGQRFAGRDRGRHAAIASRRFRRRTCGPCGKSWKAKRECWARLAPRFWPQPRSLS